MTVESSLLKISKSRLDMVLDSQLCLVLLEPGKLDHSAPEVPSQLNQFVTVIYPEGWSQSIEL